MNKTVILASHIPNTDNLWVGETILKRIKEYLPDAKIVVGINPSNCIEDWIKIIKNYTEHYEITPPNLVIRSDASSYQSGLRLYKNLGIDNDVFVWFLHTQGTKSGRHEVRESHLRCLYKILKPTSL